MKYKFVIGIDPDLHKSGVAIYNTETKQLNSCTSLNMWTLFDNLKEWILWSKPKDILIRLEYPSNTNTYHKGGKGAALNVGKNQAVAIIIKEFLEEYKIPHELIKPAGYSNFFKDESLFKNTTKFNGRTNQDARAAAAMCWNYC